MGFKMTNNGIKDKIIEVQQRRLIKSAEKAFNEAKLTVNMQRFTIRVDTVVDQAGGSGLGRAIGGGLLFGPLGAAAGLASRRPHIQHKEKVQVEHKDKTTIELINDDTIVKVYNTVTKDEYNFEFASCQAEYQPNNNITLIYDDHNDACVFKGNVVSIFKENLLPNQEKLNNLSDEVERLKNLNSDEVRLTYEKDLWLETWLRYSLDVIIFLGGLLSLVVYLYYCATLPWQNLLADAIVWIIIIIIPILILIVLIAPNSYYK